jgi:hypothetical protein
MPLQYLSLGSLLGAQATPANIAAAQAIIPSVALPFSNYQGTISQMLKPFPQYAAVTYLWGNQGVSTFNSLQVTVDHRYSHGLALNFNYTFSKEMDNLASNRNPFAGNLDRAPGTTDRPHVLNTVIVYALPFGAGHSLGKR